MQRENLRLLKFDWILIILFLLLISFGWLNILSASQTGKITSYFNPNSFYGKQLIFIILSLVIVVIILSFEAPSIQVSSVKNFDKYLIYF